MIQNFANAWRNNRGNLLLMLGTVAGLLMCIVWYLDLVPDVRFVARSVSGTQISKSLRSDQNPLVVTLRIPVQPNAPDEMPMVDLRFIVELHLPNDTLQSEQIPLFTRIVTLRNDGRPQAVVFGDLQPGFYAVLAYIDLNSNDKFDCDDAMKPLEPFRLSRGVTAKESLVKESVPKPNAPSQSVAQENASAEKPHPLDLEQAGIEVISGQVTLIEFDFRMSADR